MPDPPATTIRPTPWQPSDLPIPDASVRPAPAPLPSRGPSPEMEVIWAPAQQIRAAHDVWLRVLWAQMLDTTPSICTGSDYGSYVEAANRFAAGGPGQSTWIDEIRSVEATTRHRLMSILQVFDRQAGSYGKLHLGMTSHDVEETVEYTTVDQAALLLEQHLLAVVANLAELVETWAPVPLVGRTHGQPAQLTTLGRRFAPNLETLTGCWWQLHGWREARSARPVSGAVGTMADMAAVLGHTLPVCRTTAWTEGVSNPLDVLRLEIAPRQVADRLWLHDLGAVLTRTAIACAQTAGTVRLMALQGLLNETPTDGQVGSSAMAHKHNPRYSERVVATARIVTGHARTLTDSVADVWLEGDVAGSAVNRQTLPALFGAVDAQLADMVWVLQHLQPDWAAIDGEIQRYGPYLATGRILAAAVQTGMPREAAHKAIRRAYDGVHPDLVLHRLGTDPDLPDLPLRELVHQAVTDPGAARYQATQVVVDARDLVGQYMGPRWDPGGRL